VADPLAQGLLRPDAVRRASECTTGRECSDGAPVAWAILHAARAPTDPKMIRPVLLLVTTRTYRAGAFLQAAERLGLTMTVATDHPLAWRSGSPVGLMALDFDHPGEAVEALLNAPGPGFQAVLSAEDEGVIAAAAVSARLQLRHNSSEAVAITRDKAHFRQHLDQAGLALNPHFWVLPLEMDPEEAAARVEYPCVLKPRSLAGSRGVIRANDPGEFVAAFRRTARIIRAATPRDTEDIHTTLLVESYLPGSEHALEGLLSDGRLELLAIFDKPDPLVGPFFEETLYVTPSRLEPAMRQAIHACVAQAVSAIGLTHGPVHAEVRVHEGRVWILEIAARSIGGLCSRALRFEGGRSLEEILLLHAVGLPLPGLRLEPAASGVMMIPIPGAGTLRSVDGVEAAAAVPGITEVVIELRPGEPAVPLPEGGAYLGFLFAEGELPAQVEASLRSAHACLRIDLAPAAGP
jgi:biotin carboxylase